MRSLGWVNYSWKCMSLICDERVINLQHTKVCVFSDSVLCRGEIFETPIERMGTKIGFKSFLVYRSFDRVNGEPVEFEWNISQDSTRCSTVKKSNVYC